ncbi:MAG: DUF4442 domain-containing protein [Longimicrobiales bacterium]|nr:DUF4442 domain-containing protein [Longimicrobiales bacterium]
MSASKHSAQSASQKLQSLWARLSPLPGGRRLFSRALGFLIPYSGSLGATVLDFRPGRVRLRLRERRAVRNHLGSIHAIALANLGELATGLALVGALGPEARGILTGLDVRYHKKARGIVEIEASCQVPVVTESMDRSVSAEILDASGDVVATVTAHWRLGPVPAR